MFTVCGGKFILFSSSRDYMKQQNFVLLLWLLSELTGIQGDAQQFTVLWIYVSFSNEGTHFSLRLPLHEQWLSASKNVKNWDNQLIGISSVLTRSRTKFLMMKIHWMWLKEHGECKHVSLWRHNNVFGNIWVLLFILCYWKYITPEFMSVEWCLVAVNTSRLLLADIPSLVFTLLPKLSKRWVIFF